MSNQRERIDVDIEFWGDYTEGCTYEDGEYLDPLLPAL